MFSPNKMVLERELHIGLFLLNPNALGEVFMGNVLPESLDRM